MLQGGVLIAIMLLAGALFGGVVRRCVAAPIGRLRAMMLRVEQDHDLTGRAEVLCHDEIGETAASFDRLMTALRSGFGRIAGDAAGVAEVARQLADASSQVRESSCQQSESAASMSAAVEQMTVSIGHVADNARQVHELGDQTFAQGREGFGHVTRLASVLEGVGDAVKQLEGAMSAFMESTRTISALTSEVRDIADQTNLLALNAAIEAARAGEQGRGFAVVADEVRKLAEKSGRAAAEIDLVTRRIGDQGRDVTEAMGASNHRLSDAETLMAAVSGALHEVESLIDRTRGGIREISAAMGEQSAATESIAGSVERIARMAEQNAASAQQASESAQRMRDLSGQLHATVATYRIA